MGAGSGTSILRMPLLVAKTSGTSIPVFVLPFQNLSLYLTGTGTISAGTLFVEEEDYDEGSTPGSTTWSDITRNQPIDLTQITAGQAQAWALPAPGAYSYIRVRIGTAVTGGGTVTVRLVGN